MREGKDFFFEKKKQKTFASAVADLTDKSFLVLFFKKGLLACLILLTKPALAASITVMLAGRPIKISCDD